MLGGGGKSGGWWLACAGQNTPGPACVAPGNESGMWYVISKCTCVCDELPGETLFAACASEKSGQSPLTQSASTGGGGGAEGGIGHWSE